MTQTTRNSPLAVCVPSGQFCWQRQASASQSLKSHFVETHWWKKENSVMLALLVVRTATPAVMRNAGSSLTQSAVTEIRPAAETVTTPRVGRCVGRHNPTLAKMKPTALADQQSALHHHHSRMIAHAWTRANAEQGTACHTARQEERFLACVTQRWMRASGAVDLHTMLPASRRNQWKY